MALYGCNIHHGKHIYQNIGMTSMVLHHEGISIAKYIHWNTG